MKNKLISWLFILFVTLIPFTGKKGHPVFINPNEVAAIVLEPAAFSTPVTYIILKSGDKVYVKEPIDVAVDKLRGDGQ